jgi:subtilisin family serine protease
MFPPGQNGGPPTPGSSGHGPPGNINLPPPGAPFVPNEILLEVDSGTPASYLVRLAQRLGLTLIQSQSFSLSGRTLLQFQINNGRSVVSVLRSLARYARISAAQPNYLYLLQQGAPAVTREVPRDSSVVQYVVDKLHLREAHEITNGDDVAIAVIDSQVDGMQPELAGSVAGTFDATGQPPAPHPHGTAIAGAIAAHAKLIGIAPRVKLFAARVFSGSGENAQASTFNLLKGIDWAASQNVRILNMSFAGPNDPMIRNMISKAHARGLVMVAAVGNAGPRSPPLYPAAYPDVIGVTATDSDDKLMPQANRGRQVAVSAPGVDIVAPAPSGSYQVTSGTSVAAAHVSGVVALLLARDPKLTPTAVKKILTGSAHGLGRPAHEVGAGEIDALSALRALQK